MLVSMTIYLEVGGIQAQILVHVKDVQ